jgi:citrate synthase
MPAGTAKGLEGVAIADSAISSIAGWTAHVMERKENNRWIGPLSQYVGPEPRSYIPMEER